MARKKLIKGSNAERVEKRISQVPEDIDDNISVFSILRQAEDGVDAEKDENVYPIAKHKKTTGIKKIKKKTTAKSRKRKEVKKGTEVKKSEIKDLKNIEDKDQEEQVNTSRTSVRLTKNEKTVIIKSCTAYKNTLPVYLRYVQKEVKIIDNIIRKLK